MNERPNMENETQMTLERKIIEIRRRMGKNLRGSLAWHKTTGEIIERAVSDIADIIPEKKDEVREKLNDPSLLTETGIESLLNRVVDVEIELLARHLSLEELERRIHDEFKREKYQELTRGLFYKLGVLGRTVEIHIPTTFFESSALAVESIKEGLKLLAKKILTGGECGNVRIVTGHSMLVIKKSRLFTSLGFEVAVDSVGMKKPFMEMSREKLLEKYGS